MNPGGVAKCRSCKSTYTLERFRTLDLTRVHRLSGGGSKPPEPVAIVVRRCPCGGPVDILVDKEGNHAP